MNAMQVFPNNEFGELGVLEIDGKPYFPATASAKILGYAKPRNAISMHCKGALKQGVLTKGGVQEVTFISEGDLYRLITHSKLPAAERFEKWVFDEVLPKIRKTGNYGAPTAGLTKLAEQMAQVATTMVMAVEKLTSLVDRLAERSVQECAIAQSGAATPTAPSPEIIAFNQTGCKLETFPPDIVRKVEEMLTAITALGTAVSGNSEQVLRQIEVTIKNYERTRREERRGLFGEQSELPAGGGLPAARIRGGNTIDFGEIRTDEGAVFEGGAPGAVQPAATQREADGSPDGTDEGQRPHEVGGPDEQREGESGGEDTQRFDLQLEDASEGEIPNLFDLAGSTIPLTNEPIKGTAPIRPLLPQNVIDAALTLGANDQNSRLRVIAEFMKNKPLDENVRFLQAHYKENGAGFYVGERKYSLWYNEAGIQIAPGESAITWNATAVTWEQAAERIRELLDEGRYASQAMLYRAWSFEKNRVAEALQYLYRDQAPPGQDHAWLAGFTMHPAQIYRLTGLCASGAIFYFTG